MHGTNLHSEFTVYARATTLSIPLHGITILIVDDTNRVLNIILPASMIFITI